MKGEFVVVHCFRGLILAPKRSKRKKTFLFNRILLGRDGGGGREVGRMGAKEPWVDLVR